MKFKTTHEYLWHILLGMLAFFLLLPIVFAISTSFKELSEAYNNVLGIIPEQPTLQNYINVFTKLPLLRITFNTFLIAAVVTLFKTVTSLFMLLYILILKVKNGCILC
jgi:sn-glycerol 3-phosphate transport system permease protein